MVTFWDTTCLIVIGVGVYIYGQLSSNYYSGGILLNFESMIRYCSTWHFVVIALERMCFMLWPTNSIIRRASVKESVIISFGFILFSVLKTYIPYISLEFNREIDSCLVLIFSVVIPFILLFTSSFIILYKLNNNMRRITPIPQNPVSVSTLLSIKMVIVVAIYYLLTTAPLTILSLIKYYYFIRKHVVYDLYIEQINKIFIVLWVSNSSIKFYLYTIFISHVRKQFVNICKTAFFKIKNNFRI